MTNFNFLSKFEDWLGELSSRMSLVGLSYDASGARVARERLKDKLDKLVNCAKSVMQIFATYATSASANFVGKESNESTVMYWVKSMIPSCWFRYASVITLICFLGIGEIWGETETSTFTSKNLAVGDGEPAWTGSTGSNSDNSEFGVSGRGVQYSAANGTTKTFTSTAFRNKTIKSVSAVVSRNKSGYDVSISVTVNGSTLGSGDTSGNQPNNETITTSDDTGIPCSTGDVVVTLTTGGPSSSAKSMYVKSISVTYSDGCASTLSTPIVTATPTSGQVVLTWPDVANATKYQLKWNGGSWTDAVSGVTKTSLTNGTEYTYQVKAIGNGSTICDSDPTESTKVIPGTYYTVTWMLNGSTYETTSVRSGTKPTFPDNPSSCDLTSTTFMGWTQTGWSGKIDDISKKTTDATKIYAKASDMPDVSGAVTYYAVFAKKDGGEPTSVTSYSAGNYYLVAKYSTSYYAMSGSTTSGITAVNVTSAVTYNSTPKTITVDPSSFTADMVYAISGTTSAATITQAGTVVGNSSSGDFNRTGTWAISDISSAKTFRFSGNSRCIMYRNTPIFKNYATSNAGGTGYGDGYLYLVPAPTYSKYLTSCCTPLGSINGSVSLSQGGTSVTISGWDDVSNAGSYTVKMYHYNTSTSTWDLVSGTSSSISGSEGTKTGVTNISTGVTFTGLTLNDDYRFSVQAIASSASYCDGDETFATSINSTSVASTPFKLSYSIYIDNGSNSGWAYHQLEDDGTIDITLLGGIDYYQFKIAGGFSGWWGAENEVNKYNIGGAEWTLNGSNNVRLQTFVGGTYTFTVDLSSVNPKVTISYPSATQEAGYLVYWDASIVSNWNHLYFRVGTDANANTNASDCKVDGNIVPGTDRFYKIPTVYFGNMRVWAIANKEGLTGSNTNGVYKTNTGDEHAISKSTEYQDYAVDEGGVTLVPSSSTGTIGSQEHDNNCYFYPVTKTDGMLTHNVAVGAKPTGGSITVTYTNTSGTSGQTVTDGNNADLAHRCILNVVATPETGYNLATFTKNASAFAGGNYILTEDVAFAATFSLKQTTVTLNNHEATTAGAANVTATYSQAVPSIAANLPAKTGYVFGGYWTGEDGTGTKYINADGTSANNWSIVDATTTLHAQWTPKRCTVTLTAGTGNNGSAVFDYDATTYVSFSPAVRVGWTCTGYWTGTGGTGIKILNADGTRADNVAGWWVSNKWSVDNTSATLYAGWTNTYGGDEFELVLDLSELSAGKKIIILDKDCATALSTTQQTNNRASVAASTDGGFTMSGDNNVATLKAATSVQVMTLEATGTANQYYLNVEDGYLFAAGENSNYYLKTRANNSSDPTFAQFLFTLSNGEFTIRGQGANKNGYLRKNTSSALFSCYANAGDQKAVLVYVKRESCDDPANALSVSASPTAISTATGFNTSTLGTTGGNGETVYYRVISSNKANATIDGTTFSATTAGTYTVQAYQLKNENICRQISTVDITVTTPVLTTSKNTHTFEKTATGNSRNTNTITISGANLVGDVSVALSGANADQFSISTTSVTAASAMESAQAITVTYSPTTAGTHTATITFSSTGAADKVVTITGTAADFYTVTWHISGSSNQTSQVESGTKPTFPSNPESCDDESTTFIGWTQTPWSGKLAQSAIDAKTADNVKVYKAASELPNVGGAIDYYAVWAKASTESDVVGNSLTATGLAAKNNTSWVTINSIAGSTTDATYKLYSMGTQISNSSNYETYGMKWSASNGYLETVTSPTNGNKLYSVTVKTMTEDKSVTIYGSDEDDDTWHNLTSLTGTTSGATYVFTSAYTWIKVAGNSSSCAIESITITYGAYEDYLTTCCETTNLTFGTIADPVTEYNILREDLSSASEAVSINCNFESLNTSTEITWYSTNRAARTFVTPTGATTSTTPSPQLAEMTIDIAKKKITATSVGVYTITIHQDEATISATKYCERTASVTVNVTVRDKFVDMLNGEDVGVGGNSVITRDDTGGGIYTPTESDFDTDDLCKTTKRKLIGWIKAGDLKTSYGDANRVDEIDDLKTATPATNKIIAPNTQVQATGTTWYAVWADID